eukprot:CAMPEP_0194165662 /NCGR_PEP_ID=MMETSP0154-20130528/1511_1 /TAXON_ID=1049557 /ORGANISM="Thalassiothrix antarctica, Strain L6-D1" /LENGTH=334 /DNA_ID=CAMNT_0038876163 /DNA_START=60 /DNA_END=1061 /DNA_ORIENTATION=-
MSESTTSAKKAKKELPGGSYSLPWVEKYRPLTLDEVVGNEDTIVRLQAIAEDGNMPNLILCGPPGTGKTTSVHALARQLLGKEYYQSAVLELNASDARGIDVVRNKIKSFCQSKRTLPSNRHKIVILDEADSMTSAAQQAMRRTMEIYSKTTRFVLACNISTKIIEPIQSRAAILRYSKLTDEQVLVRLRQVCKEESVSYDVDGLEALLFTAEGDMRHALNNVQATVSGFGHVSANNVWKVCDQPHPTIVRQMIDACCKKADVKLAKKHMEALWNAGYSASDIIGTTFRVTKAHRELDEGLLLEFLREIGFTHMRIAKGVDSLLQLLGLVSRLC